MTRALIAAWLICLPAAGAAAAEAFKLASPIDCEIGRDCFVQNYVDVDPGPEFSDYNCGKQSYDGHKGTDIRVRSLADAAKGVDVLAAADGVVRGRRDGMADRLVKSDAARAKIADRECGNGMVIDHGEGWQTQYCHMQRGSVKVQKGDVVKAGDVLGRVGYSGNAAFPHLHVTVRKGKQIVDPFRGLEAGSAACGVGKAPLWSAKLMKSLRYRSSQMLDAGFATGKVALAQVEKGVAQAQRPLPDSPALVGWGWAINLLEGDEVVVILVGPAGEMARNKVTLKGNKAQYMLFAGKKRTGERWRDGKYHVFFGVLRNGKRILMDSRPFTMN